jgi:hypothetical protein
MALRYTSVKEFWRRAGILQSSLSSVPGRTVEREELVVSSTLDNTYFISQQGIDKDSLIIYKGDTSTELIIDTDYTFDPDISKVIITTAGNTKLDGSPPTAVYFMSKLGSDLGYTASYELLEQCENQLHDDIGTVFVDQLSSTQTEGVIGYLKMYNKILLGQGIIKNRYDIGMYPLVKLDTTVAVDYTEGDGEIQLTSESENELLYGKHE